MDWLECNKKKFVKDVKIDKNLINSLIKSSGKKLSTQDSITLNDDTATSKVSLTYEALRELLEALAISNGFKIYNHECFFGFLKTELGKTELAEKFDRFRKIRNSINYYGSEIHASGATGIVKEMDGLRTKIIRLHFNETPD